MVIHTVRAALTARLILFMRLITVSLMTAPLLVQAEGIWQRMTTPAYGLWSLGGVAKDSLFRDVRPTLAPALLVFGGYGDVFIEANRFGYSLYRDGTSFASVIGNFRSHTSLSREQINASQVLSRYRLETRNNALEVGIQVGRRLPLGWIGRAALLQDVSSAHGSREGELLFYRRDQSGPVRLLTTVGAQYQSQRFNDYYFGIDASELADPAVQQGYRPAAGFSAELEMIATYDITIHANQSWGFYAGFRHFYYGREVADSPLTKGSLVQQYFIGLGRYF